MKPKRQSLRKRMSASVFKILRRRDSESDDHPLLDEESALREPVLSNY